MNNDEITENGESTAESSTETTAAQVGDGASNDSNETQTVESIDYTEHLVLIEQGQQVLSGLMCVIIGLILISVIFNVLKRFF